MTTLSTHDTKRGEDVRARISVLSEIPDRWADLVTSWTDRLRSPTGRWRTAVAGRRRRLAASTGSGCTPTRRRPHGRPGRRPGGSTPTSSSRRGCTRWSTPCYDDPRIAPELGRTGRRHPGRGWTNSLGAKLIQLTVPGVPDVYQGTELWENSLVDPDNRRPVDFEALSAAARPSGRTAACRRWRPTAPPSCWSPPARCGCAGIGPDLFTGYSRCTPPATPPSTWSRSTAAGRSPWPPGCRSACAPRAAGGTRAITLPDGSWHDVLGDGERRRGSDPGADDPATAIRSRCWSAGHDAGRTATAGPAPAGRFPASCRCGHRAASTVSAVVAGADLPMESDGAGWWSTTPALPGDGDDYGYASTAATRLPDPRSRRQPDGVHGPSRTFDPSAHVWADAAWTGRQLAGGVIYELHLGTFTPEGTLDAAVDKLDHLVALGVDFVELLPVNAFNGVHNWGYDGVLWYAVHEAYGGPAAYQRFVDACHARGLGGDPGRRLQPPRHQRQLPAGVRAVPARRAARTPGAIVGQPGRHRTRTRSAGTSSTTL